MKIGTSGIIIEVTICEGQMFVMASKARWGISKMMHETLNCRVGVGVRGNAKSHFQKQLFLNYI